MILNKISVIHPHVDPTQAVMSNMVRLDANANRDTLVNHLSVNQNAPEAQIVQQPKLAFEKNVKTPVKELVA